VADSVTFLGTLDTAELSVAYAACDTFAMVPRSLGGDVEGFGIVYLEAGLLGKPVVGSRSGGVTEAVVDGETGLLVRPGDVGELADAFRKLMDDTKLRKRLGRGGQDRLKRDFGDNRQARKFYAAVREAVTR
jgi:phosphatidylinositol alpha-1,6-mannosyltransferase